MRTDRRATDRAPEHTIPWWVPAAFLVLMLAPVVIPMIVGGQHG